MLRLATLLATLFLFSLHLFAQNRITGTVTDATGKGIPGVTVTVKGTNTATQTNETGSFTINAPSNATLVMSAVGYSVTEIALGGQTSVTVRMNTQESALNEVVVTGYGTQRRRDLTGSVASVSARNFNKGVVTAPDQLIQGKVAGVQIVNSSGQPGAAAAVRIRGVASIRAGTQPLYVLDGVQLPGVDARPGSNLGIGTSPSTNPLNFLNPNDIASIEVLKDASATAIYGSRGANGVVIITTRRGQTGQPTLELSTSAGISTVMKRLEVLDGDEYRAALKQYNLTSGDFGGNEDAFDAITRTAYTQNHNFGIGGGSEGARYRFSGGYQDIQGVVRSSQMRKFTGNFSGNFTFLESKRLGLDINLLGTGIQENIAPISEDAGFQGSVIGQALQWNPTHPLRRPNDSIWRNHGLGATTVNPLALLEDWNDRAITSTLIGSISPYFNIVNGLQFRTLISLNKGFGNRRTMLSARTNIQGLEGIGAAGISNNELTTVQFTNTLNFNRQVTSAVYLNAVAGYEYYSTNARNFGVFGRRFPSDISLNYTNLIQYSEQSSRGIGSYESPVTELQSYFIRANANFKDRFAVTATFRADGSTRFGENNKYGYFPSVGFAWTLSNEDFLQGNATLSNLKLRLGYGAVGNQDFTSGASLNRIVFDQQSRSQPQFGNPDLKWETSITSNIGLDFGLFRDRLTGTVEYFIRRTEDALYDQEIARPGPPGRTWINLPGNIENKGLEVSLNGALARGANFNWNVGINGAFIKNRITGLGQQFFETGALRGQGISGATSQRIINNQPLNVYYLARFTGIDRTTGQSNYEGGDPANNKFYVGSPNPKAIVGFSTDATYKKLSLTVNMNGAFGHYLYNNTANTVLPIGNLGTRNIPKSLIGTGVLENTANPVAPSTRYLEKGDYLKLANATLSYRVGNIGAFRNVLISLTGQNLFVITGFSGFDPEVNTNAAVGGIGSFGLEYTPYPTARTILLGLNFSL
jgi:iron complex outermembrane receptor protein